MREKVRYRQALFEFLKCWNCVNKGAAGHSLKFANNELNRKANKEQDNFNQFSNLNVKKGNKRHYNADV